jgi:carbamoyltransferase
MKIFATNINAHDPNSYDGETHFIAERFSRHKKHMDQGDYAQWYDTQFEPQFKSRGDDIFAFTYTLGGYKGLLSEDRDPFHNGILTSYWDEIEEFNTKWDHLWDYYLKDGIYYINHHASHAAYAFITSQYEEADILAIDGGGIGFTCCYFNSKDHKMVDLSDDLSLGWLWNISCVAAGLNVGDEGKLMGLAGYGKVNQWYYDLLEIYMAESVNQGRKFLIDRQKMRQMVIDRLSNEDVAATIQQYTYDKVEEFLLPLKTSNNICIAGGVAYNGYMNEWFTKHWENVWVPPAPGDEGQALGTYIHADYILNKNKHIPKLYSGIRHDTQSIPGAEWLDINVVAETIANGGFVGWYQGRSESGNRALGNRSILADPRNPDAKDIINSKIKLREDWRPFAPSVLIDHYQDWFDTNQPSPYMSRIMKVKSDKIPGVTHVDGTARIQTVTSESNPRYYDLISKFYKITGVPMVLNTSFNCREPIVEKPDDALATFNRVGLDLLVINNIMVRK